LNGLMTASIFFMSIKPGLSGPPTKVQAARSLLRCQRREQQLRFACAVPSSNDEDCSMAVVAGIVGRTAIFSPSRGTPAAQYGTGSRTQIRQRSRCRTFAQLNQMQIARFLCMGWSKYIRHGYGLRGLSKSIRGRYSILSLRLVRTECHRCAERTPI
jgi:hypothetical protein